MASEQPMGVYLSRWLTVLQPSHPTLEIKKVWYWMLPCLLPQYQYVLSFSFFKFQIIYVQFAVNLFICLKIRLSSLKNKKKILQIIKRFSTLSDCNKQKKHRFLSASYIINEVSITYHPFVFGILPQLFLCILHQL